MSASLLAAWWMHGIVIAALLAGTAALLQRLARDTVPARALWGAAMLGATLLTFLAPFRLVEPGPRARPRAVQGMALPSALTGASSLDLARVARAAGQRVRTGLETPMRLVSDAARGVPDSAARGALGAWVVIAGALLTMLVVSHRRLRRLLGAAERREIAGIPVRLTADLGPAVVGVRAPVVAVPRWLLDLPVAEQALVVRHEQSHVAARDPLLLMSGVALAAVQPWNPFVWLMLSRLRLAIELDCDRRLLRHGTSPRAYGDLLIALSAAASPAPRPALIHPMFSIHRSHLAQRIIAMTERPVRLITARRVAVAALAALALVAACESRLPTDADVREMDAESAVQSVAGVAAIDTDNVRYFVDGKRVTPAVAKEIPADRISSVSIEGGKSEVHITTGTSNVIRADGSALVERRVEGRPLSATEAPFVTLRDSSTPRVLIRDDVQLGQPRPDSRFLKGFTGVLLIDGVVTTHDKFAELTADRIETVEVIKGAAATRLYGAQATNGVISVKTKPRR